MFLGESRVERVSVPYGIQDSKMGISQDFVKNPKDSSRSLDLQSSFNVKLPVTDWFDFISRDKAIEY